MPCFKGLAVSIHTSDGPLPEYSIQKQTKFSRITSYIPVPPPKITTNSATAKPEQSTFAISIALLTPGLNVPYSTPKPTPENPYPRPQLVNGLPGITNERGRYASVVGPYVPLTTSPNETIAAYIYFDGRQKEEVATLLRRGEETWVNSRWVSVPESEGGGLAEREFLFREVGLERWLNGLDLEGKDVAAKIERRRQKIEKRRQKKPEAKGSDDEDDIVRWRRPQTFDKGVLRYGANERSPLEKLSDEDDLFSSDDDSDDDPVPEATGQIKVVLFRVLASGEIKKGEYLPQFDAHDDDEDTGKDGENGNSANASGEADIDHTTSFAQPKTLDPRSISTQTVTGIDGPDTPYAVFTFLYRGEKQLQKMGILKSSKRDKPTSSTAKRRSIQIDFAKLKPLKSGGALGFTSFRNTSDSRDKSNSKKNGNDNEMESDEEDEPSSEGIIKIEDAEGDDFHNSMLSPEDAKRQGELAEGVKKIKLKRQHSFEPPATSPSGAPATRGKSDSKSNSPTPTTADSPPTLLTSAIYDPTTSPPKDFTDPWSGTPKPTADAEKAIWNTGDRKIKIEDDAIIGSPMKKQRASMSGLETEFRKADTARVSALDPASAGLGMAFAGVGAEGVGNDFGGELRRASGVVPGAGPAAPGDLGTRAGGMEEVDTQHHPYVGAPDTQRDDYEDQQPDTQRHDGMEEEEL
ncbi:hypothetical protein MMC13_002448 [Lambiella insularis]|nr:hypothetical protein [Lambiella insularis]